MPAGCAVISYIILLFFTYHTYRMGFWLLIIFALLASFFACILTPEPETKDNHGNSKLNDEDVKSITDILNRSIAAEVEKEMSKEESKPKAKKGDSFPIKISVEQYDALQRVMKRGLDFCNKLSQNEAFREHCYSEAEDGATIEKKEVNDFASVLEILFFKDILTCFKRLGHPIEEFTYPHAHSAINLNRPEGQVLFNILNFYLGDRNSIDNFKRLMLLENPITDDICERERSIVIALLSSLYECPASATSPHHDDFHIVIMLWLHDLKDETLEYRSIIFEVAQTLALSDGLITREEQLWLDQLERNLNRDEPIPLEENQPEATQPTDAPALPSADSQPASEGQQASAPAPAATAQSTPHRDPKEELQSLIGLEEVKNDLRSLADFIAINQQRSQAGMKVAPISYHCVFTGNPGTGKTTVARILAGIYKELGILQTGQLVETDRSGLVAEYVGQTAVKTNKIIDKAIGGVLFIDEAYTLAQGDEKDYGAEAIATLLKRMEDDRDRLVVILAGYTDEINGFMNTNPGLRSRFNRYIHFKDYTEAELYQIFEMQAKKYDYCLAAEAVPVLQDKLKDAIINKPKDFGNARFVRNLFEKVIENQACRLSKETNVDKDQLSVLTMEDLNVI